MSTCREEHVPMTPSAACASDVCFAPNTGSIRPLSRSECASMIANDEYSIAAHTSGSLPWNPVVQATLGNSIGTLGPWGQTGRSREPSLSRQAKNREGSKTIFRCRSSLTHLDPSTSYSVSYSQKTRTLDFSSFASTSTVRSPRWSISSSRFSGLI